MLLNDVHSALNSTRVAEVVLVHDEQEVQEVVRRAGRDGLSIAVAGGRHAMGGQQFLTDGVVIDASALDAVTGLDSERGTVRVGAGVRWPALMAWLEQTQGEGAGHWSIRQKQTGADSLSIGGAVSSNVHGRGLTMGPIIDDIESMRIVDAHGEAVEISRGARPHLFAAACGGYGMFGVITEVTLRLQRRERLCRDVDVIDAADLPERFAASVAAGYRYGDWQFEIDPTSDGYLGCGIMSRYRPLTEDEHGIEEPPSGRVALARDDWARLVGLARIDKRRAFQLYREHYLATDGQHYWSDAHQRATYLDNYAELLDAAHPGGERSTLMITELFVGREHLLSLLDAARRTLLTHDAEVIYGTVRLVEPDTTTLLAWARRPWACVVLNLLVEHTPDGIEQASTTFQALIDDAMSLGGSYYLTYHRWARAQQLVRAHPRIADFVEAKRMHDPDGRFRSDWYDHVSAQVEGVAVAEQP